ncbi:ATP-binding protein [Gilvimarinus sp. SDUM040013]|uniref:histidine kinase n=1 Tax=Gilvimarinus gilvus TaxID=3058038 RepID=A0ABU4RXB6_9GAMM|nr:ATP-binding protein [Gilvimarinus sp. SDUM040013]MDO3386643.1 ATP-binding protein [Gilvimarinus sp. SDUM040013]MDX6849470.1 ATP-binding protein [Gilvimarinus sp. SDUM040013]
MGSKIKPELGSTFSSLYARLLLTVLLTSASALVVGGLVWYWLGFTAAALGAGIIAGALTASVFAKILNSTVSQGLDAVDQGIMNLLDSDYSATLSASGIRELQGSQARINQLLSVLREERQSIYQRELLLDTIIENSELCVVLVDQRNRIVYSNRIARRWLRGAGAMNGLTVQTVLADSPELLTAVLAKQSGIFPLACDSDAICLLSCGQFVLNAQQHTLIMLRDMTETLSRQEAQAWKKVIRVVSHELNNSLAPISSLAHSGKLMLEQGIYEDLDDVFTTLVARSRYLADFVGSYAAIAKLPAPHKTDVNWREFVGSVLKGSPYQCTQELPVTAGYFDESQMFQVVQNLLKNAAESGAPASAIELCVSQKGTTSTILILDQGPGMNESKLKKALLPFYSTKPGGSGTGLPLCREIVESHGGSLTLANRAQGGLQVKIELPLPR